LHRGSFGCLLSCASGSELPEVLPISMGGEVVPVQGVPVRMVAFTSVVPGLDSAHRDDLPERLPLSPGLLSGRLPGLRRKQVECREEHPSSPLSTPSLWVHTQYEEVQTGGLPVSGVPWIDGRFSLDGAIGAGRSVETIPQQRQEDANSHVDWQDDVSPQPSISGGSTSILRAVLPGPPTTDGRPSGLFENSSSPRLGGDPPVREGHPRPHILDRVLGPMEWERNSDIRPRRVPDLRCGPRGVLSSPFSLTLTTLQLRASTMTLLLIFPIVQVGWMDAANGSTDQFGSGAFSAADQAGQHERNSYSIHWDSLQDPCLV
jgi:hypothetical protein